MKYITNIMKDGDVFELKSEHILLLQHGEWIWNSNSYVGAIEMNSKRPFGNSGNIRIAKDIYEIINGKTNKDFYDDENEELVNDMLELYSNIFIAHDIILKTKSFKIGKYVYRRKDGYYIWKVK